MKLNTYKKNLRDSNILFIGTNGIIKHNFEVVIEIMKIGSRFEHDKFKYFHIITGNTIGKSYKELSFDGEIKNILDKQNVQLKGGNRNIDMDLRNNIENHKINEYSFDGSSQIIEYKNMGDNKKIRIYYLPII